MKKYHSITELEELTNIPDSTIRRYIAKFPDFFISQNGRVKKYEESAVKVLTRIKLLFDNGHGTKEVDAILRNDFPMVVSGDEEVVTNTPTLATAEDIAEIKELLAEQKEFNKLLVENLANEKKENEEFRSYIRESLEKQNQSIKQRDQLLLQEINERLESKKEAAATKEAEEPETKKGLFARFLDLFGK